MNTITMYPLDFEEFCWANGLTQEVIEEALVLYDGNVERSGKVAYLPIYMTMFI